MSNLFTKNCACWYRFIDDTFAIWVGDIEFLLLFNTYLNNLIPGLKFNMYVNKTVIPFLDTCFSINDGQIISDLYRKPTD